MILYILAQLNVDRANLLEEKYPDILSFVPGLALVLMQSAFHFAS